MTDRSLHRGEQHPGMLSVFVPLALLTLLIAAYRWAYRFLPPRHQVDWGQEDGVNWFGHGQAACYGFAVAIFVFMFTVRYGIVKRTGFLATALSWYGLLLALVVPGVWLLVDFDWDNEFGSWEANWIGYPIALLAVSTAFLFYDVVAEIRLSPGRYAARCLIEVVFIAVWAVAWGYFEMFGLGW